MRVEILFSLFLSLSAQAAFSPNEVINAEQVKRNVYISDAVVWGGDPLANPVILSSVRWAKNPGGYERLVIDLGGEGSGWETKIPPYFQVGLDSKQSAISVSIRGVSRRDLNNDSIKRAILKSTLLSKAYIAPALEGDLAALEFHTQSPVDLETFYLVNPPRIVIDVRAKR